MPLKLKHAGARALFAVARDDRGATKRSATVTVTNVTPVPIMLSAVQQSGTRFAFSYSANLGLRYAVERSTTLSNWTTIRSNTANVNPMTVTDTAATNRMDLGLFTETFNSGNGGFTVTTPQPYGGPWNYNSGAGTWQECGHGLPDNGHPNTAFLDSPPLTITAAGQAVLSFNHRWSREQDSKNWDGNQLRVSVNGGAFVAVPGTSFISKGYNGTVNGTMGSALDGQQGWVGTSPGYTNGLGNRVACVMNDSKNTQENQGNPSLCPQLRTTDLIPPLDTVSMKPKNATATAKSENLWTKAPVANLVRYEPSGIYFARAKVRGKLIRKSLETNVLSVAKQRLADVLDAEHKALAPKNAKIVGKMTFSQALAIFNERQKQSTEIKRRTKEYNERAAESLLKTWGGLGETDVRKITKADCLQWRAEFGRKYSATVTNGTLSILRRVLDIAIEAGVRYDNPAKAKEVRRARVRQKELRLPEPDQFVALLNHVRGNGSGHGGHSADAIQFFAYAGPRLGEAKRIYGRDCNFTKGEIIIRGDPETGTKNWEMRRVPMIPEMRKLLERLKEKRGEEKFLNSPVCAVRKFNRSLKNACKKLGLHHLTHHDLRHLFATRCIESGVPIPTVAKWLGHKDGGVLAMQTYGHLRDKHSADMAQKVVFAEEKSAPAPTEPKPTTATAPTPANVLQLPPEEQEVVNGDHKKAIAKAKAKYKFPWWASANPLEIFWGQANEEVRIVPFEKYLEATKAAMEREVFAHELADAQTLIDEFVERVSAKTLEELSAKIPQRFPRVARLSTQAVS